MNCARLTEDILSDDYEEGEILDEDILYDNVSSLEEFSDPESDKRLESRGTKSEDRRLKSRRKKDHKCKEGSVCRKERTGKHCFARIHKRRNSLDSKLRNSSNKPALSSETEKKCRPLAVSRSISPIRGYSKKDSQSKTKIDSIGKNAPHYLPHFRNEARGNFQRKLTLDRQRGRGRRFSADGHQERVRKRKSLSPSPRVNVKTLHDANRVIAKSSLRDRLVGSGSISQKCHVSYDSDESSAKTCHFVGKSDLVVVTPAESLEVGDDENRDQPIALDSNGVGKYNNELGCARGANDNEEYVNDEAAFHIMCPAEIPVPPTPKAMSPLLEPQKEEIDELNLRLIALKTAIMKKHTDLKRKKKLVASNKKTFEPVNDSFTEFALMGVVDDDCDSMPTPPPPGTDSWPSEAPVVRDLEDPRWTDEDIVIDQESNNGDTIIEANISASDLSLPIFERRLAETASPSSQDKLPCCKGNPIPVVTPHRPAKEVDDRRPTLSSSSSVIIPVPFTDKNVNAPLSLPVETPKYLKEINSNLKSGMKRRKSSKRLRRRRNSLRQRTPGTRRIEKPLHSKGMISKKPKFVEKDEDEDELRQLALMSVKPKNTIKSGSLAKVEPNLNPLRIETDPAVLEVKNSSLVKNTSPAETWEDLDEDILRAQLLSSLSRSIPVVPNQPMHVQLPTHERLVIEHEIPLRDDALTKRLNKENVFTKRNVIVHPSSTKIMKRNTKKYINPKALSLKASQLNPPAVKKFIINVSESETSEDDEAKCVREKIVSDFEIAVNQKLNLEHSIDKLLEETRKETELNQMTSTYYQIYDEAAPTLQNFKQEKVSPVPMDAEKPDEVILPPMEEPVKTSYLPPWQLEEFERQKRSMVLKESVLEAAKEKIRAKNMLGPNKGTTIPSLLTNASSSSLQNDLLSGDLLSPRVETEKCLTEDSTSQPIVTDPGDEISKVSVSCDSKTVTDVEKDSACIIEGASESWEGTLENEVKNRLDLMISEICVIMEETALMGGETVSLKDDLCIEGVVGASDFSDQRSLEGPTRTTSECGTISKATSQVSTTEYSLTIPSTSKVAPVTKTTAALPHSTGTPATGKPTSKSPQPKSDSRVLSTATVALPNRPVGNSNKMLAESIKRSPLRTIVNPAIQKRSQRLTVTNKNQVSTLLNANIHSAIRKPSLAFRDSSYALKGLNEMADLVSGLENGMSDFKNLERDYFAQRRQLLLTQQTLSTKKQQLLSMKVAIDNKKRLLQSAISMDTSSLSPLPDTRDQPKQSRSRASEILNLQLKEMCLKAQFAMMSLDTRVKDSAAKTLKTERPLDNLNDSPRKKMRLKMKPTPAVAKVTPTKVAAPVATVAKPPRRGNLDPGTSQKRVISVRDKDKMDPLIPLCPYDMQGVCKDEECQYQHLQTE